MHTQARLTRRALRIARRIDWSSRLYWPIAYDSPLHRHATAHYARGLHSGLIRGTSTRVEYID